METGQVGKSADFVVEAIGTEVGTLGKWLGGMRHVTKRTDVEEELGRTVRHGRLSG